MIVQVKTEITILDDHENPLLDTEVNVLKMDWFDKWQCKHIFSLFNNDVWEKIRGLIRSL